MPPSKLPYFDPPYNDPAKGAQLAKALADLIAASRSMDAVSFTAGLLNALSYAVSATLARVDAGDERAARLAYLEHVRSHLNETVVVLGKLLDFEKTR
jgi:hypothetical protein